MADELSVEQILTNLVANAHRYGGDRIVVEAEPEDGLVRLCVSDNGPGVDADIEESLFEPFVRGASDQGQGAGLGLAISRRLADAMHGTLTYERDDGVSRFVVELPAAA
jgi:signal transduction histidine kinase